MSHQVVQGKFTILYVKLGTAFYPIACAQQSAIEFTTDLLELAPRTSTHWREYEYGRSTGTITGAGLTKVVTAPENLYTIFDLAGFQLNRQKILVKYSAVDNLGSARVYECNCLIIRTGLEKSSGAMLGHGFTLQITGQPVLSTTPVVDTNPEILVYEYLGLGIETFIDIPEIVSTSTLLVVYIDGYSKKISIYPDGYGPDGVQWNPATSRLTFGTSLGLDQWVKVIYVELTDVGETPEEELEFAIEDGTGEVFEDGTGEAFILE